MNMCRHLPVHVSWSQEVLCDSEENSVVLISDLAHTGTFDWSQNRDKRPCPGSLGSWKSSEEAGSWCKRSWVISLWRGRVEELCKTSFQPVDGTWQGEGKELWAGYSCG